MIHKSILVVDDEQAIRDLFKTAFVMAGFEVTTAENGEKALEIIKSSSIHIMFLDLKMPGMNGLELCREIRKIHEDSRIFAVTGFYNEFTPETVTEAGFDDYFFKPVSINTLVDAAVNAYDDLTK